MATYNGVSGAGIGGRLGLLVGVLVAIAALVSAILVPAAIAVDRGFAMVNETLLDVPPLPEGELADLAANSVMYAADGSRLAELHDVENRVPVDLSEVPSTTQNAVLATEDANFYQHRGINHRAIFRALVRNVQAGEVEEGGSTVTQQLVKNTLLTHAQTVDRKIQEAIWSLELERRMSKQEILEAYLNTAYFGRGVYGIGTAARFYFSKHVSQLDVAESAMLAGLIRSPERNNPVNHMDAAQARRDIVLRQMAREGFITSTEAEAAIGQPIELNIREDPGPVEPFFVEWVKRMLYDEVVTIQPDILPALGDDREQRQRAVFEGGLRIHTTLETEFQDLAEETLLSYLDDPLTSPMGNLTTLDTETGALVAMAIGPKSFGDCPDEELQEGEAPEEPCEFTKLNPVVFGGGGSGRQTGSAFKPFVLTAALEEGFTPGYTTQTDSETEIEDCGAPGEPYAPRNFAGGGGGDMDMYQAIRVSNNVYHATLTRDVGPVKVAEVTQRMGIEHLITAGDITERHCSLGLGAADVFPLEFAAAFATLANRGTACAPFAITRIEDREGNILYSHRDECERAIDRGIADRVTDLLRGPVRPGGTAGYVESQLGRPVAGKTGTTNNFVDAWFAGYVPQYATVAWVGYEHPEPLENVTTGGQTYARVTGGALPGRIWADYMERMLVDVEVRDFAQPPPIPTTTVPDVVGMMQSEAVETLEERDFTTRARTVEHHEPAGTVVTQNPEGGTDAWVGSRVTLEISDGSLDPPTVEVPDVIGMSPEDAREILEDAGFVVSERRRPGPRPDDPVVVDQDPPPGTGAAPGSRVIITVGEFDDDGDDNGDDDGDDNGDDDGDDEDDSSGDGGDRGPPGSDGDGDD